MIKGFEDITTDIKPHEIAIAPFIADAFRKRQPGKKNAASNKQIREAVFKHTGTKLDSIRIRRIVQYIRVNAMVIRICSSSNGYFVAANDKEWEDWKESMRQRIRQQQYTLACSEYFGDGNKEKL